MTNASRYLALPALFLSTVSAVLGASTAQSSAFGEYVKIDVLPLLGSPVQVTSGPLPSVAGSAPPAYSQNGQVASVLVAAPPLGTVLKTGILTVNAASSLPANNSVSADATVNDTNSLVATLVGLTADVIQSNVSIGGACGSVSTVGTTKLVNAKLSGLLGLSLPLNPAPNTVVLNLLGVKVVLNEQIASANGLTVNAVHITLSNAPSSLGVISGQIIISQSQASLVCAPANADITLTKTADPSTVVTGSNITYTLQALNHGPDAATNVKISDTLPANVSFVSATPTQGQCTGTTAIVCNLGSLNASASASVQVVVTAVSGSSVTNSATVSSDIPDNKPGDNTSTVTTTVTTPNADLSLTETATPSPVTAGSNITYTLQISNHGPDTATNTLLSDTLPANVTLVSVTPSQGSCSGTTAIVCNLGTVNASGGASVQVVAKVISGSSVTNSATVSSDIADSNPADNSATVTTAVNAANADLSLTKASIPTTAITVGQNFKYSLQVKNAGPGAAPNTTITDTLPAEVTFVSASPTQGSCSGSATVTCNVGTLAVNGSATVMITVTASRIPTTTGRRATNTASVKSDAPDPNPANNTASSSNEIH